MQRHHPNLAAFLATYLTDEIGAWSDQPPTEAELARILADGLEAYPESR
jgi:hypothetical protein